MPCCVIIAILFLKVWDVEEKIKPFLEKVRIIFGFSNKSVKKDKMKKQDQDPRSSVNRPKAYFQ